MQLPEWYAPRAYLLVRSIRYDVERRHVFLHVNGGTLRRYPRTRVPLATIHGGLVRGPFVFVPRDVIVDL